MRDNGERERKWEERERERESLLKNEENWDCLFNLDISRGSVINITCTQTLLILVNTFC